MVCRESGVSARIRSTSGRKPRSSISSASSRTSAADVAELQVALLGQVEQPARGADDDLDAACQRLDLRLVGAAAVDGEDADAAAAAGASRGRRPPGRPARGWGRRRGPAACPASASGVEPLVGRGDDPLQQRDAEAERLAGAGLGLADDVVAGQRDRQGHRLDRERVGDAGLGQRRDDVGVHVEVGEGLWSRRWTGWAGRARQRQARRLDEVSVMRCSRSGRASRGLRVAAGGVASRSEVCRRSVGA